MLPVPAKTTTDNIQIDISTRIADCWRLHDNRHYGWPKLSITLDFSRLRSPTDIDAFPSIRDSFIDLDWDYASVTDLSTDQQFAIPQQIAVGYFKALKIKKILCHPYNAYLYIRHCDKIVLIPKCIPSKPNIPKLTQASHPQTSDFKVQMPQLEFQPKVFSLYPKLPMDSLEDTVVQTVTYKIPQYWFFFAF